MEEKGGGLEELGPIFKGERCLEAYAEGADSLGLTGPSRSNFSLLSFLAPAKVALPLRWAVEKYEKKM